MFEIHVLEQRLGQWVIEDMVLLDDRIRVVAGNAMVLLWMLSFFVCHRGPGSTQIWCPFLPMCVKDW